MTIRIEIKCQACKINMVHGDKPSTGDIDLCPWASDDPDGNIPQFINPHDGSSIQATCWACLCLEPVERY